MAWTKAKTVIVVGASLLLVSGTTVIVTKGIQRNRMYSWRSEGITEPVIAALDQLPREVWILPARNTRQGNQFAKKGDKLIGRNVPFSWLLRDAYGVTPARMVLSNAPHDDRSYDFMSTLSVGSAEGLQQEINRTFKVIVRREMRNTGVFVLKPGPRGVIGLRPPTANPTTELRAGKDTLTWVAQPLATMNDFLEDFLKLPVIDQTGLTNTYDISLQWDDQWWFNRRDMPDGLRQVILDRVGLELVPTNMPVEMLVVEKVK